MGKFSALLLASDFDDTLLPTSHLAAQGTAAREISRENREALSYVHGAQRRHFRALCAKHSHECTCHRLRRRGAV